MNRLIRLLMFAVLVLPSSVLGQDVPSGPEKGKAVPALTVFDATGAQAGKRIDYAAERAGKPTVYVFVQADTWDRPMARFLRTLDEAVRKQGGDARVIAVWVGGDPERNKEYLPVARNALKLQATALTAFTGAAAGPDDWGINDQAHLTAVVASQGKVAAVFGWRSINETNVPEVAEALKSAVRAE